MSRDYVASLKAVSPLWWGAVAGAATAGAVIFPESRVLGAACIGAAMLALAVYQTPCCDDCASGDCASKAAAAAASSGASSGAASGVGGVGALERMAAPQATEPAFDGGALLGQASRVTSGACS